MSVWHITIKSVTKHNIKSITMGIYFRLSNSWYKIQAKTKL